MSFLEISNIKLSYNSLRDDIINEFYIPCLQRAVMYKRAVGFFSSNILLQITNGLGAFADNGGKMKLLISPKLDPEDYEAIKAGYDMKKYVTEKLEKNFDFETTYDQKEKRFGMLSHMISTGLLDIRIVVVECNYERAMFHRKIGIMKDNHDNYICFSGSSNETYNGYVLNDEELDVYCSWKSEENSSRCAEKEFSFDSIWNGSFKGLVTIPFPEAIKEKLLVYRDYNNEKFVEIDKRFAEYSESLNRKDESPRIKQGIELHDYQKNAIDNWEKNGFKGIFDMATGTGKTFTAAGAICRIYEKKKRIFIIICCPYTHLVDQWYDELKANFNIESIKCYGTEDYEKVLKRKIIKFKQKRIDFVCAIITNASFKRDFIQSLINENLKHTLLVVDEAHNFGAEGIAKFLSVDFPYRLALSATFERYRDEKGTQQLYDFFGKKCIEYTLDEAIQNGYLTQYKYYPILVYLSDDEYEKYIKISKQIAKCRSSSGELSERGKKLLIERARIIAGTEDKLYKLNEAIIPYKKESNMLVYCGTVKYDHAIFSDRTGTEFRQIDEVCALLNKNLGMYSTKFTAEENSEERHEILDAFKEERFQVLIAIKCLDEGVNIPAIKTAFILASSTNPKEYIQRRGRVLRKAKGKQFAEIFDFITLPRPIDEICSFNNPNFCIEKNLARKEMDRIIEFSRLAINSSFSNEVRQMIREAYKMDIITEGEELYE